MDSFAAGDPTSEVAAVQVSDLTIAAATDDDAGAMTAEHKKRVDLSIYPVFTWSARRTGTWTTGQAINMALDTTDGAARVAVPDGFKLEVLGFHGHMLAGSTVGAYKFRGFVREYTNHQSSTGGTRHYLDNDDWTTTEGQHKRYPRQWDGITPLATVVGSASMSVHFGLRNHSSSAGTTTSDNITFHVAYRIVPV